MSNRVRCIVGAHDATCNMRQLKIVFRSLYTHLCYLSLSSPTDRNPAILTMKGLIFLSAMSHGIATKMISDAGGKHMIDDLLVAEIVSTTVVLLGLSTASLGAVLILAGKFRFADAVAYLPLPVVGGA